MLELLSKMWGEASAEELARRIGRSVTVTRRNLMALYRSGWVNKTFEKGRARGGKKYYWTISGWGYRKYKAWKEKKGRIVDSM